MTAVAPGKKFIRCVMAKDGFGLVSQLIEKVYMRDVSFLGTTVWIMPLSCLFLALFLSGCCKKMGSIWLESGQEEIIRETDCLDQNFEDTSFTYFRGDGSGANFRNAREQAMNELKKDVAKSISLSFTSRKVNLSESLMDDITGLIIIQECRKISLRKFYHACKPEQTANRTFYSVLLTGRLARAELMRVIRNNVNLKNEKKDEEKDANMK